MGFRKRQPVALCASRVQMEAKFFLKIPSPALQPTGLHNCFHTRDSEDFTRGLNLFAGAIRKRFVFSSQEFFSEVFFPVGYHKSCRI